MDNLGIKTTIYDVLGYVVPGAVFLSSFGALYYPEFFYSTEFFSRKIEWPAGILIFIFSYLTGHFLSAVGAFILENSFSMNFFRKIHLGNMSMYNKGATKLFGLPYDECEFRHIASYCQSKHPDIYETAFVFLAIYGLNRNIFSAMLLLLPIVFFSPSLFYVKVFYFCTMLLFFYNYIRFRKNYLHQISAPLTFV